MKKSIYVLLALLLAFPALSFAGSATSRWDLTIGGYVKFDMGYNTQGQGQDIITAARSGYGAYSNVNDQYGNFFSYAGETRLNFLTRGPDAWGAKTFAFVEGHFRGSESGTGNGTFLLRHAFMQFEWPNWQLMIGQNWNQWGNLPSFRLLSFNDFGLFLKGQRQPQIRVKQLIGKNWNWTFAVMSPTDVMGRNVNQTSSGVVDAFTRSETPFYEAQVEWISDKCGNIGPWKLLFALGGFYGQQKQIVQRYTGTEANPTSISFDDKTVNSWGIALKGYIPIIPEKKGNKKGAMSVSGVLFYAQNPGWYNASLGGPYARTSTGDVSASNGVLSQAYTAGIPDYAAPTQYGGWGQIQYFLTDQLSINGQYGYFRANLSSTYQSTTSQANSLQDDTQISGTIMYDLNAAIRFGFEYAHYKTRYAGWGTVIAGVPQAQKDGSAQSFRVGAYYFF